MNAPTTPGGSLLGLPAFRVELRYITEELDRTGARIEAVQLSKPYVDERLAGIEYERLFDQFHHDGQRDGRWRLVLIDNGGKILRESTR